MPVATVHSFFRYLVTTQLPKLVAPVAKVSVHSQVASGTTTITILRTVADVLVSFFDEGYIVSRIC